MTPNPPSPTVEKWEKLEVGGVGYLHVNRHRYFISEERTQKIINDLIEEHNKILEKSLQEAKAEERHHLVGEIEGLGVNGGGQYKKEWADGYLQAKKDVLAIMRGNS